MKTSPAPRATLTRRLLVRFPAELFAELESLARAQALSRGALVRQLVLTGRKSRTAAAPDSRLVALSALIASEHTRLLLEALFPESRVVGQRLEEAALRAAQARLLSVSPDSEEER